MVLLAKAATLKSSTHCLSKSFCNTGASTPEHQPCRKLARRSRWARHRPCLWRGGFALQSFDSKGKLSPSAIEALAVCHAESGCALKAHQPPTRTTQSELRGTAEMQKQALSIQAHLEAWASPVSSSAERPTCARPYLSSAGRLTTTESRCFSPAVSASYPRSA